MGCSSECLAWCNAALVLCAAGGWKSGDEGGQGLGPRVGDKLTAHSRSIEFQGQGFGEKGFWCSVFIETSGLQGFGVAAVNFKVLGCKDYSVSRGPYFQSTSVS